MAAEAGGYGSPTCPSTAAARPFAGGVDVSRVCAPRSAWSRGCGARAARGPPAGEGLLLLGCGSWRLRAMAAEGRRGAGAFLGAAVVAAPVWLRAAGLARQSGERLLLGRACLGRGDVGAAFLGAAVVTGAGGDADGAEGAASCSGVRARVASSYADQRFSCWVSALCELTPVSVSSLVATITTAAVRPAMAIIATASSVRRWL